MGHISDLSVDKVSLVGSPANKRSFLLFKSRKKQRKEDGVADKDKKKKKSIVTAATELFVKYRDNLKKYVEELRKYSKDILEKELTNDEIKLHTATAEVAVKLEKLVEGNIAKDAVNALVKAVKEGTVADAEALKAELKKSVYADLSFWFSEDDALALFSAAQGVVEVEKSDPEDTGDPEDKPADEPTDSGGTESGSETETQTDEPEGGGENVTKEEKERAAALKAQEARIKKLEERNEALEKRLAKGEEVSELRLAKEWIRKNAPYAGVDINETAQELVDVEKISESAAKKMKAVLKRLSKANYGGGAFDTAGGSGGPSRFRRSSGRDPVAKGLISKELHGVLKAAGTAISKGEETSMVDAIDKEMQTDENLDAYILHREAHEARIRRGGGPLHVENSIH